MAILRKDVDIMFPFLSTGRYNQRTSIRFHLVRRHLLLGRKRKIGKLDPELAQSHIGNFRRSDFSCPSHIGLGQLRILQIERVVITLSMAPTVGLGAIRVMVGEETYRVAGSKGVI